MSLLWDFLRKLSGLIDWGLYSLASSIYDVFLEICRVDLLAGGLGDIVTRIYVIIGLFMFIKISAALFKYIVNPDTFSDTGKGAGKLMKNVVVALLLIVSVPTLYQWAMNIQEKVLTSGVISNFLLGTKPSENESVSAGGNIAYSLFSSFFVPKIGANYGSTATACANQYIKAKDAPTKYLKSLKEMQEAIKIEYGLDIELKEQSILSYECYDALVKSEVFDKNQLQYTNTYVMSQLINGIEGIDLIVNGAGTIKGDNTFTYETKAPLYAELSSKAKDASDNTYVFTYSWGISWIVAAFLIFMFAGFCVDVGIRVVKLAFLVIIAPIPILTMVDPTNSGKTFSEWGKMLAFTYADVFIRYASVFFVVFVIQRIPLVLEQINTAGSALAKVFVIFGALLFAKELPKLISTLIPGMKEYGGATGLNSLKRLGDAPLLGRGVKAAAGAGLAAGAMLKNQAKLNRAQNKGTLRKAYSDAKGDTKGWKAFKKGLAGMGNQKLKNMGSNLKNNTKAAGKGIGTGAKSGWESTGWDGNEKKQGAFSKFSAEASKATGEQLKQMREGMKEKKKNEKVYGSVMSSAEKTYDSEHGKGSFASASKSDREAAISQAEMSSYGSTAFREAVRATNDAKATMYAKQDIAAAAQNEFNNSGTVSITTKNSDGTTSVEVKSGQDARDYINASVSASKKASTNYETCKDNLKKEGTMHPSDAETYQRYTAEKDRQEKVIGSITVVPDGEIPKSVTNVTGKKVNTTESETAGVAVMKSQEQAKITGTSASPGQLALPAPNSTIHESDIDKK